MTRPLKYRIIIDCNNEWLRLEWWDLLDAYITYLETTRADLFDNEDWSIQMDVVEE